MNQNSPLIVGLSVHYCTLYPPTKSDTIIHITHMTAIFQKARLLFYIHSYNFVYFRIWAGKFSESK